MLTKEGFNANNEHLWTLRVPCIPTLEVGIIATDSGLVIDGNLILWGELEVAKREAQRGLLKPKHKDFYSRLWEK